MSFGYLGDTSTKIKQQVKNNGLISVTDIFLRNAASFSAPKSDGFPPFAINNANGLEHVEPSNLILFSLDTKTAKFAELLFIISII